MVLVRVKLAKVEYTWTTLPFGWNKYPSIYSTRSEAKVHYLRRHGFPVLSYIDGSSIGTSLKSKHPSDRNQRVEVVRALLLAVTVAFFCEYFLSSKKRELACTQSLRCMGSIGESRRAVFLVPQNMVDILQGFDGRGARE